MHMSKVTQLWKKMGETEALFSYMYSCKLYLEFGPVVTSQDVGQRIWMRHSLECCFHCFLLLVAENS